MLWVGIHKALGEQWGAKWIRQEVINLEHSLVIVLRLLWKNLVKHKCTAIQVVRNVDKKHLAPCQNCAPVVQALGV